MTEGKRIIIEMNVDYWNDGMRKILMHFLIHNLQIIDDDDNTNFEGVIIEPLKPYPLIPIDSEQDKEYKIEW